MGDGGSSVSNAVIMLWSILSLLRKNPDKLKWSQQVRRLDTQGIGRVKELDSTWRKAITELNELRRQHNLTTHEIAQSSEVDKVEKISLARKLSETMKQKEKEAASIQEMLMQSLLNVPNVLHETAPSGTTEADNVPMKYWGHPRVWSGHIDDFILKYGHAVKYEESDLKPDSHVDKLQALGVADTYRASKVAGTRFYYLLKDVVWLEFALVIYALKNLAKDGFLPIEPPFMMGRRPYEGVTSLGDFEDSLYKIQDEDLYLIATSEHPIAAYHMDEVIPIDDLPLKYAGISACFRKEAGAHGKDTKGIFRVHQFNKVEQFVFCLPEESWAWHEKLIANAERLYQGLQLPYRIVNVCAGEMGSVAAKKYDLELWMPSQGVYREAVSCSNCTDYQSVRLRIKYTKQIGNSPKGFVHTLNSTAIATARTITAIVENNQRPDGTVAIPRILWPFMETFLGFPLEAIHPGDES